MRRLMLGLVAVCLLSALATAQATRTWISGVGDDANPCSRTAPCKTFAGAISKTAAGGEIDALDPGGYGAVTITKAITLDGGGGQVASILVSGTNGVTVNAGPSDVVILRNLRFAGYNGAGLNAIDYRAGKRVVVENCAIMGFGTNGIFAEAGTSGQLVVQNTSVVNSGNGGIAVMAGRAAISDSNLSGNSYGVLVYSGAKVTVTRTVATDSSNRGFHASSGELTVSDSTAANNYIGVSSSGGTVRISNMTITDNSSGIYTSGSGHVYSWGNNHIAGNTYNSALGAIASQ